MRKAITFLQSAHRLYGDSIDSDAISVIAGVVPQVFRFSYDSSRLFSLSVSSLFFSHVDNSCVFEKRYFPFLFF